MSHAPNRCTWPFTTVFGNLASATVIGVIVNDTEEQAECGVRGRGLCAQRQIMVRCPQVSHAPCRRTWPFTTVFGNLAFATVIGVIVNLAAARAECGVRSARARLVRAAPDHGAVHMCFRRMRTRSGMKMDGS